MEIDRAYAMANWDLGMQMTRQGMATPKDVLISGADYLVFLSNPALYMKEMFQE